MKNAVIYGRVSTQDQDFFRQINELDEWAVKNSYKVAGRFAEKITGVSKAGARTEFNKMLKFIDKHDIKMILVSELSRIGRLGVHTRVEIEQLAEKGVNIFFYDKNQFTLNNGKIDSHTMMMLGLILDLAKIEIDNTKNRIISGLRNSAKNGKIQGAKFKAYGFAGDENKNIITVDSEIKVIKDIFKKYDGGMTTSAISAFLNTHKIPTRYNEFVGTTIRGKKAESFSWTDRTVHRILTNRMLIGERHHKGELVFNFESTVDKIVFERVQKKLKDRTNRPIKVIKNDNFLKGIIHCTCGMPMYMSINVKKRVNSYICLSNRYAKEKKCESCGNPSVSIPKLLDSLFDILNENFISKMKGKKNDNTIDEKISYKTIEVTNSEGVVKKLKSKLNNLYDDYNERLITKQLYIEKKEQIEKKILAEDENRERLKIEVDSLHTLKNKPLKAFYSKNEFLTEAKNIIQSVTIGKAKKQDESLIVKTPKDIGIGVTINTITGQKFNYVLSKFSSNFLFDKKLSPINTKIFNQTSFREGFEMQKFSDKFQSREKKTFVINQ